MADITCAAPPATVGETYTWTPTIVDPVTNLPPSPDLSTYAAGDFEVRSAPGGPILLQATLSNGQMTFGASGTGQFTVTFPSASITTAGSYTWEAKFTDSSGNVSKPFGGQFQINPTYTS